MNARQPPSKRSRIERQMDKLILGMFILLFLMCVIGASCFTVWTRAAGNTMWYLRPENTAAAVSPTLQVFLHGFNTSPYRKQRFYLHPKSSWHGLLLRSVPRQPLLGCVAT